MQDLWNHPRKNPAQRKLKQSDNLNYTPAMLMTVAIILITLWALGLVTSTTMGGLVHILLVVAVIVMLLKVIQDRRIH